MTVNRKDTILIAVLMNVGLLSILFITAMSYEDETIAAKPKPQPVVVEATVVETPSEYLQLVSSQDLPNDEVDRVLQAYEEQKKTEEPPAQIKEPPKESKKHVEITVKRGDSLERIARANKTTVSTIKKLNNLKTDRLRIGQVLKIPLPDKKVASVTPTQTTPPPGAVFYEMQSGDNPWKVAKKFNVSYESIIELNELDESKAKNLKPGDKIRIK